MEPRKEAEIQDIDLTSMGVLLAVVTAAFIALGVMVYFFGEDHSSMSAANNPPAQSRTVGQGSQSGGR